MKSFKVLMRIAWRNILRNRRRSLLTLSVLIIGSTGIILISGFFINCMEGLREQLIHSQYGHIQVNADGYYRKGVTAPYDYLISDTQKIQTLIENTPNVLFTVPRLKLSGMASSDRASVPVIAVGTDPVSESRMGKDKAGNVEVPSVNIVAGRDLDANDAYGVLLGRGLMKSLGVKVGDTVNFITTREAGALDGAALTVRGAFETIIKDFDDHAIKMNLPVLQKITATEGRVHSFLVLLDQTANTESAQQALIGQFRAKGLKLEAMTWREMDSMYGQFQDFSDRLNLTIQIIVSIVFFFSVANTLNMALFERIREFGTMMAMGNGRGTIFSVIFAEVGLLAFSGTVLGIGFGLLMAKGVSMIGIQMPPPPMGTNSYTAMISITPLLLVRTALVTMISTLLSGIIPSYKASHFRIVEALGYV